MNKKEFRTRWESDSEGGGITMEEVADCAEEWGLFSQPRICKMEDVLCSVLIAANVKDAEEYLPKD